MPAKCKFFLPIFLFLFFISASEVSAQTDVVINEFSSRGDTEWVELYNKGAGDVDITNWTISDEKQPPETLSGVIKAGEYSVFEKTKGWLNDNGDVITLKNDGGDTINSVAYGDSVGSIVGAPDLDKSAGRVPDGSDIWQKNLVWTKGYANPGPTPSPTPTPTPGPTSTPTPTPTKTPTATPKPTVKAVATKKPEVISTGTTSDEEESEVLGLREGLEPSSPTPIPESEEKGKIPITAMLFVLGGLGFMGVAGYPFLKSMKKRYNIENEEKEAAEGGFKPEDSQESS